MKYNPVGWFDIPVSDMARAKKFYETVLQIEMKADNLPNYEMVRFPMDSNVGGISGALFKGEGYVPGPTGQVVYFTALDLDEAVERALALGSKVILPKKDLGDWGHISWVTDSEGNIMALHRPKAK